LFWNKKPATIYLGDAGALYLGFLLAAIAIRIDLNSELTINRVVILLLGLALPIIDITQVVISRLLKGKSPFQGGRDHISHILLDRGYSQGKVLMILTTLSIIFSSIALFIAEVV
jgi:UDP-GlcNAc:undecaprenyl-phosphate GlcNAc-1-phosphate transferase